MRPQYDAQPTATKSSDSVSIWNVQLPSLQKTPSASPPALPFTATAMCASGAAPFVSWNTSSANCAPATDGSVVAVTAITCALLASKVPTKIVSALAPVPGNANDGG